MPSDLQHEALFHQLREVISTTDKALSENRLDNIGALVSEHNNIMARIYRAGDCREPHLTELMSEIKTEIEHVQEKAEMWRDTIREGLKAANNRNKLARAYGIQERPGVGRGKSTTGK